MKNIIKQLFLRFLKENNLLFKYKYPYYLSKNRNLLEYHKILYTNRDINDLRLFDNFLRKNIFKPFFINFLITNNILDAYINNINIESKNTFKINNINKLDGDFPLFIRSAFTWRTTKEGANFWNAIDDKWTNIYYKIMNYKMP